MLTLEDVHVAISGVSILRGITLEVPQGTVVGFVGRNGAGKSTTMKAIMGLVPVARGRVTLDGQDLLKVAPYLRPTLGIGYLPEDRRLIPTLSVHENLLLPVWAMGLPDGEARIKTIYERIPQVAAFANRQASQLSGGQQKLAALARALVVARRLLLLDEPFEGLAPALAEEMARGIRAFLGEGLAILIAESERRHIADIAERMILIERGAIVEHDSGASWE